MIKNAFQYNNNSASFKKWSLIAPAVFDALSNKKKYRTLYTVLRLNFLANTLSNLHSEKNAKQGFEMPGIWKKMLL